LSPACAPPGPAGRPQQEIRTFGSVSAEILALGDWLGAAACTHIAMEGTGVYQQLTHIEELEAHLEEVSAEVASRLREHDELLTRLDGIPGVGRRTAEIFAAEAGTNMAQFPSSKHFASWTAVCPGHHESAGKQRSGRTRKGNVYLKSALVEAAQAAARTKGSSLAALAQRVAARRGRKRAILVVAHRIAVLLYCLARDGTTYEEREDSAREAAQAAKRERRLVEELRGRGYEVTRGAA
jgi:transposase